MSGFSLTALALSDLRNISRYTERKWGRAQRSVYIRQINSRFQWLSQNPRLGKARTDIGDGYFAYPEGEHLIFYRMIDSDIEIIAIPHRQMDIAHHLP